LEANGKRKRQCWYKINERERRIIEKKKSTKKEQKEKGDFGAGMCGCRCGKRRYKRSMRGGGKQAQKKKGPFKDGSTEIR